MIFFSLRISISVLKIFFQCFSFFKNCISSISFPAQFHDVFSRICVFSRFFFSLRISISVLNIFSNVFPFGSQHGNFCVLSSAHVCTFQFLWGNSLKNTCRNFGKEFSAVALVFTVVLECERRPQGLFCFQKLNIG